MNNLTLAGVWDRQWRLFVATKQRLRTSSPAHFGLGDATIIDTLRIEWPSGIVHELRGVAAGQCLTVTEPARWSSVTPTRQF